MLSELMGYHALWRLYGDLHARWLITTPAGVPVAPFVELWANRMEPTAPAMPLNFELASAAPQYRVPPLAKALAHGIETLVSQKLKYDEAKLRIVSFGLQDGMPKLGFTMCMYRDYLSTNWAISNLEAPLALKSEPSKTPPIWPESVITTRAPTRRRYNSFAAASSVNPALIVKTSVPFARTMDEISIRSLPRSFKVLSACSLAGACPALSRADVFVRRKLASPPLLVCAGPCFTTAAARGPRCSRAWTMCR